MKCITYPFYLFLSAAFVQISTYLKEGENKILPGSADSAGQILYKIKFIADYYWSKIIFLESVKEPASMR